MRALLISTYEIGRQPFGQSSAAAWLRQGGMEVDCLDLTLEPLDRRLVQGADLVAFYVPMHTATRIAVKCLDQVIRLNPTAHICFFGLYAPVNEAYLRKLGVRTVLGGEFEDGLMALARRLNGGDVANEAVGGQPEPVISLARQRFVVPDRKGLPALQGYARIDMRDGRVRTVGYTEASRGCLHMCRHCPIVPVYGGRLRIVQRDVVLADIRQQIDQGAEHITFGDPDFFNAPRHAVSVVCALHTEFPDLTYDVTIKIEHLRRRQDLLPVLCDTNCLFVTSAVESIDDHTLAIYEKNHTREDFIAVAAEFERLGLALSPTFVSFSPWTTIRSFASLLQLIARLHLIGNVAPIQYAIRLLIPSGSRLLELPEVRGLIQEFDDEALSYPWFHSDCSVDDLHNAVRDRVEMGTSLGESREEIFVQIWRLTREALAGSPDEELLKATPPIQTSGPPIPFVTEPWYCCAEPTDRQLRVAIQPSV